MASKQDSKQPSTADEQVAVTTAKAADGPPNTAANKSDNKTDKANADAQSKDAATPQPKKEEKEYSMIGNFSVGKSNQQAFRL
jgi:hypothetical protein